jgi:hypothetical protein
MLAFARLKVRTKTSRQAVQRFLDSEEKGRTILREYSPEIVGRELDTLKISRASYNWYEMFTVEMGCFFLIYDEEFVIPGYDSDLGSSIGAKRLPIKSLPALVHYVTLPRI